jgi:hypothetical protein
MLRLRGGEASCRLLRQPWSPLQLLQGLPAQGSRRAFHRRRQDPAARTRMRSEASTGSASARSAHGWPSSIPRPCLTTRAASAASAPTPASRPPTVPASAPGSRPASEPGTTPAANSAKSRPAANATALAASRRRTPGPAAPAPTAGPAAATAVPTPLTTTRPPTTAPGAATTFDTPRPPRPTSPRKPTPAGPSRAAPGQVRSVGDDGRIVTRPSTEQGERYGSPATAATNGSVSL